MCILPLWVPTRQYVMTLSGYQIGCWVSWQDTLSSVKGNTCLIPESRAGLVTMYHPYPSGHYSLVYVHWRLKTPALVPDKFSSSLKSWKGTFTYKIKAKIRKDYVLTRGFAAIHTINSCHLLSIYSCPKHFTCIIFTLSSQVLKVRAFIIFILLARWTSGDLESLLHLRSEGGSSWPHFKSGRPSLGSPSNPWLWVSLPPLLCSFSLAGVFCSKLVLGLLQIPGLLNDITSPSDLKGYSGSCATMFCP